MRIRIILIWWLVLMVCLTGCKDDFNPYGNLRPVLSAHYLHPTESNFVVDSSDPFTIDFAVNSFETSWEFTEVSSWLSISPQSGRESSAITLSGEKNDKAGSNRTEIFYLCSSDPLWDCAKPLTVSQAAAAPVLTISEKELSFSGASGRQSVTITSNCVWKASVEEVWVTLAEENGDGSLSVSVESNPLPSYRRAVIMITYGDNKNVYLNVLQAPAEISASSYSLEYENVASLYEVIIDSETDWRATPSDSWISISPDMGKEGKTLVSVEVAPNTSVALRSGYVALFTGDSQRLQIKIQQKGLYINADEELTFPSTPSSCILDIISNASWSVMSHPSWLSLSESEGFGNAEVKVSVGDNSSTALRNGEIVIGCPGLSLECRVKVCQNGKTFSSETSCLEFSEKGGKLSLNLTTDSPWTSHCSDDWFDTDPKYGSGDAVVTVTAAPNNTTEERVGTLSFTYSDGVASVGVRQFARYLTVDNDMFEFESHGGIHVLSLSTNENWTARVEHDSEWLHLSKASGSGKDEITISVDDNPTVSFRSSAILIDSEFSQGIRVLVSQRPRFLSLSSESVLFFSRGGESESITISTDGSYIIQSDADWFDIKKGTGDTFSVVAEWNPEENQRVGKITISLTDLLEGSLTLSINVVQAGKGGSFILSGFSEDYDWNGNGSGNISLTIKGYTVDSNWDISGDSSISIRMEGFSSDEDWNLKDGTSDKIVRYFFGDEKNWNVPKNSNSTKPDSSI